MPDSHQDIRNGRERRCESEAAIINNLNLTLREVRNAEEDLSI